MSRQKLLVVGVACAALLVVGIFVAGLVNSAQSATRPVVGSTAPDFVVTLYDRYRAGLPEKIKLSDLHGRVVLLNFWASWCIECRKESDTLESVWKEYQSKGLVVLGIDYLDTEDAAYTYLRNYNTTYANGADIQQTVSRLYRITGVPETFIIDKQGVVRAVVLQALSRDEILTIITPLLTD